MKMLRRAFLLFSFGEFNEWKCGASFCFARASFFLALLMNENEDTPAEVFSSTGSLWEFQDASCSHLNHQPRMTRPLQTLNCLEF